MNNILNMKPSASRDFMYEIKGDIATKYSHHIATNLIIKTHGVRCGSFDL